MRPDRFRVDFCHKINRMRIPRLFLIAALAMPLQLLAQPVATRISSDWGWLSLVFIFVAVVLTSLYSLSKAIESLVDRIREKTDLSGRL